MRTRKLEWLQKRTIIRVIMFTRAIIASINGEAAKTGTGERQNDAKFYFKADPNRPRN